VCSAARPRANDALVLLGVVDSSGLPVASPGSQKYLLNITFFLYLLTPKREDQKKKQGGKNTAYDGYHRQIAGSGNIRAKPGRPTRYQPATVSMRRYYYMRSLPRQIAKIVSKQAKKSASLLLNILRLRGTPRES